MFLRMAKNLTFELSEEQAEFLQAAADREDTTVERVLCGLVRRRMEQDAWLARQVQIGIDAADRGDTISHEEFRENGRRLQAELGAKDAAG